MIALNYVLTLRSAIPPGKKFTYVFVADKEGTYWIHSHTPGQYPKGLRAPLIVTRDQDKADFDYIDEATVTLSDW